MESCVDRVYDVITFEQLPGEILTIDNYRFVSFSSSLFVYIVFQFPGAG